LHERGTGSLREEGIRKQKREAVQLEVPMKAEGFGKIGRKDNHTGRRKSRLRLSRGRGTQTLEGRGEKSAPRRAYRGI